MTIPKVIHQTVANKQQLHPAFAENISMLRELNPGWEHRLYDDDEILQFINTFFDSDVIRAYERINPLYGPARADFFRYLLLYRVGESIWI